MPYPARSRQQRNLTLVAALAFAWLLGAVPAHAEDKYQAHVKRGSELVRTEEYATALGQFEAAYALRQSTALLYQIARCHHRLGNTTAVSYTHLDVYKRQTLYRKRTGDSVNSRH